MLLIFKINVCFPVASCQYVTTTILPSVSIVEVPIRFRQTLELYTSLIDDFAVYMQDYVLTIYTKISSRVL